MSESVARRCVACGIEFLWAADDQDYYQRHGWPPPKRCPPCATQRRRAFQEASRRVRVAQAAHDERRERNP